MPDAFVEGIDVSSNQRQVDWSAVAKTEKAFAFARATRATIGGHQADAHFSETFYGDDIQLLWSFGEGQAEKNNDPVLVRKYSAARVTTGFEILSEIYRQPISMLINRSEWHADCSHYYWLKFRLVI